MIMEEQILEQVAQIKPKLQEQIKEISDRRDVLKERFNSILGELQVFEECWRGEWTNSSYNHYLGTPFNMGKNEVAASYESIKEIVERNLNIEYEATASQINEILDANKKLRLLFITELSIINNIEKLNEETELLDKIKDIEWGIPASELINLRKPKQVIVRNPEEVLSKGLRTPPHIAFAADVMADLSYLTTIDGFHENANRLLRQLELKMPGSKKENQLLKAKTQFVYQLIDRFHLVQNILRNRHGGRETIIIKDEYDVQDLFLGMLKIEIDDVRPEEYSPSYAGTSTRQDFLLKQEQIVLEVKKTRKGLADKEVGEQLIVDIAKYKVHPDCKHLICFVYDPENRIVNPRGLEEDLKKLSTEEMPVEVFIRP